MNWLLGIFALGVLLIAAALWRQQVKADREFMSWLESQCAPVRKEDL